MTNTKKPPFEPLFSKDEVMGALSAERCRSMDATRRIVAILATKTPDELIAMMEGNLGQVAEMAELASDLAGHALAEAQIAKTAFARIIWAAQERGLINPGEVEAS